MGEEEVEVGEHEIAEVHQPWASIVGTDVCVLPAAFPRAPPPSEGMVGWRAEVQRKRGSAVKANQQVQLFGAWFALTDTDRILPVEQLEMEEGESEGEESEEGESEGEESDEGSEGGSEEEEDAEDSSDAEGAHAPGYQGYTRPHADEPVDRPVEHLD